MSALASRLAAIKSKATVLEVKEVKTPAAIADPLKLFEANSAPKFDQANTWTIDVFPSQQTILMFIMIIASSASAAADHKDHAKSSVFTFTMYYMCIYHAFFLLNDLHVRPNPSTHARIWSESSWRSKFAEFLLSVPVPESLEKIFSQFSATQTERTANVFFVPSAAGFHHDIHFGRFFPLSMFTAMHDIAATFPGTTKREEIYSQLLNSILYTVVPTTGTKFPVSIGMLLGVNPHATASIPKSRLNQIFDKVFNPVLFRDFHRRSSLAAVSLSSPLHKTGSRHVNAYDCLFSATAPNLRELKVIMEALAPIISSVVPCKKNLASIISESSGINICQHGYSDFALPTWISMDFSSSTDHDYPTVTKTEKIELSTFSEAIGFLTKPATYPTANENITDVTVTGSTGGTLSIARHWPFSLRSKDTPTDKSPPLDQFVTFDDELSPNPKVLILDVTGNKTIDAYLATLTHKIIESFELDGCTIQQPRSDKSLGMQNCMFADSAIPLAYVYRGTSYYKRTANSHPFMPLKRAAPNSTPRLESSSLLHDRLTIMLPEIQPKIVDTLATGVGKISGIPGMTKVPDAIWLRYAQSFLGFKTKVKSSDSDDIPSMELGRLRLFSPYTFTSFEDEDQDAATVDLSLNRTYFLTNLRSIFGTDYNLIQVDHPFEAMPVL